MKQMYYEKQIGTDFYKPCQFVELFFGIILGNH